MKRRHLTKEERAEICAALLGGAKQVALARRYNVGRSTIKRVTLPPSKTCTVLGCKRPEHAMDLCTSHNKMRLRGEAFRHIGPAKIHGERVQPLCAVVDCGKVHFGRGFCVQHFNILRTYGFSPHNYDSLLRAQNGRCAICGTGNPGKKGLGLDHDHKTGAVRGLLCTSCNTGLGNFRDDPTLFEKATRYLAGADRAFSWSIRAVT